MPFFDIFASPRWSPPRMRTKVVSFFTFFQELSNEKKIEALRPKMTKNMSQRGPALRLVWVPLLNNLVCLIEQNNLFCLCSATLLGQQLWQRFQKPELKRCTSLPSISGSRRVFGEVLEQNVRSPPPKKKSMLLDVYTKTTRDRP